MFQLNEGNVYFFHAIYLNFLHVFFSRYHHFQFPNAKVVDEEEYTKQWLWQSRKRFEIKIQKKEEEGKKREDENQEEGDETREQEDPEEILLEGEDEDEEGIEETGRKNQEGDMEEEDEDK